MSAARIGIDHWPALVHAPGVGRYARELVRALLELDPELDLRLFEIGPGPRVFGDRALGLDVPRSRCSVRRVRARLPRGTLRALRGATGIGAETLLGGCELFHRVIHDQPPLAHALPQVLALSELPRAGSREEESLTRTLARIGDLVVTSRAARDELVRRFSCAPARVHSLPVGCEHWRRELGPIPDREDPPLVLVLARTDRSRGVREVLAAFEILLARGSRASLAFAGRAGDAEPLVREHAARGRGVRRLEPSERELPGLVACASALVHLAEAEWTPVTPLEAFALGTPVVASRIPAFEEALGGAAELVDAPEPQDLAGAIEAALASARDPAAEAARRRISEPFSWREHARLTLEVWRKILAR